MSPAGQSIVTVTPLNDKHANGTQKKEKDEAGLEIESVEENKKLKSKNIFEESATTKTKLAKELGSPTQLEPPSKESNNCLGHPRQLSSRRCLLTYSASCGWSWKFIIFSLDNLGKNKDF